MPVKALNTSMVKKYNPYDKYASSSDISLGDFLVEEWQCNLVEPNHSALRKRATVDPFSGDINWAEREQEMIDLMHDKLGVGLAAPQVGSSYNMFVMSHSFLGDIGVYKPEIVESEGEIDIEEGCLTWPLLYIHVKRPAKVKVRFYKNDGKTQVELWLDGIDARCFLHEYDHLQGVNFIDIVSDFKLQRAKEKREKRFKKIERAIKRR
jgi:peptide deformylase